MSQDIFIKLRIKANSSTVDIVPQNLEAPSIPNDLVLDQIITADKGVWSVSSDTIFTYQWYSNSTILDGETQQVYTVATGVNILSVRVTATSLGGTLTIESNQSTVHYPAVNTVAPVLSGTLNVGDILTCPTGTWTCADSFTYAYQWYTNGVLISGQTSNTHIILVTEVDLKCKVTTTSFGGTSSAFSNTVIPYPVITKSYRAIVSPLTFSNPNTLLNSVTGNSISVAELGGKTEQNIGSDYPQMTTTNLNPTPALKFQSLDPTSPATWAKIGQTFVSGSLTAGGSTQCTDITFSHIRTRNNKQGIEQAPQTNGMDMAFLNIIMEDHQFASMHINYSIAGKNYHNLTRRNVRSLRSLGEGCYLGNTGDEVTTFTGITDDLDSYTENSGRELFQFNGHAALHMENFTGINGGQNTSEPANQRNDIQLVNVRGWAKKGIMWNCYTGGLFGMNDFLIEDCFFGFTSANGNGPYFIDMATNNATKYMVPGGTVTIRNCTWYNPNYLLKTLFTFRDNNCNIIFEGTNTLPASATDVWADGRSSPGSNVIENHGTFVFTNTPNLPQFGDPPEAAYVGFEKVVIDDYYYNRHMGYRTP